MNLQKIEKGHPGQVMNSEQKDDSQHVSSACIKPNVAGCANVLQQLKAKAKSNYKDKVRMPSIKQIKKLLDAYGITSYMDEHTNVVEFRSKGKKYVNSRQMGKKGVRLKIPDASIELDTSSSYYSYNTWRYAEEIIELIEVYLH